MTGSTVDGGSDIRVELDENVLNRLADLICGDDTTPYYRTGRQITALFDAAGWRRVGEVDGPRRAWVLDTLQKRRRDSEALHRLLLRLADPREYLDDDEARSHLVQALNELLAVEGYQILYTNGRPELITQTPTMKRPAMQAPIQLTASLTNILSDPDFGQQLKSRLDEAHVCWQSGACTAAIIMLGSLLEGVLYDVALAQHTDGPRPTDHLQSLIELAAEKQWIAQDVIDYAHVLRNHRNLVHPKKQLNQRYAPDDDTVRIAWNVVVAALNDLEQVKR
ncbi:hypothetical protein [Micromonospora sp. NBC_01813]|uniref:hypothetical protein n=1 Tax=Micromonospora sp. NBC_01813 TaxID=2975988 RepID=UPI002DDA56D4|nr:hypothetical protein [Micromonospora sp. NBC_01813]WSA10257.1 hypothetical protein OG958_05515 [Micromonospora sp. NBC_01813]